MNTLPRGYTTETRRSGLTLVRDSQGRPLVYSLNEMQALRALRCLPQFGGVISSKTTVSKAVDL